MQISNSKMLLLTNLNLEHNFQKVSYTATEAQRWQVIREEVNYDHFGSMNGLKDYESF